MTLRTPLLRKMPIKGPRMRKCTVKGCANRFQPRNISHKVCSAECAAIHAVAERKRLDAKQTRERKQAMKTRSEWLKDAQIAFNAFIRFRDQLAGHACISSGRPLDWSGNAVDAGHFRSVGSAPHLRFNEDNCHAQSKHDNQYKSGNAVDYRLGLIARIGLARVEALEADQTPRKWTIEELKAVRDTYRAKLRAMKERA